MAPMPEKPLNIVATTSRVDVCPPGGSVNVVPFNAVACEPPLGKNWTRTLVLLPAGLALKMLRSVFHSVPNAPGVEPATGMKTSSA